MEGGPLTILRWGTWFGLSRSAFFRLRDLYATMLGLLLALQLVLYVTSVFEVTGTEIRTISRSFSGVQLAAKKPRSRGRAGADEPALSEASTSSRLSESGSDAQGEGGPARKARRFFRRKSLQRLSLRRPTGAVAGQEYAAGAAPASASPAVARTSCLTCSGRGLRKKGRGAPADRRPSLSDRYPFLSAAASRVDVTVKQELGNLAEGVATRRRCDRRSADNGLGAAFLQVLPQGPAVLEPLASEGPPHTLTVQVQCVLGSGGNGLVYAVKESLTGSSLAIKVPMRDWKEFHPGRDENGPEAHDRVGNAVDQMEFLDMLFPSGLTTREPLLSSFLTLPAMPPSRIKGLPAAISLGTPLVALNAVSVFEAAASDVLRLRFQGSVTAAMGEYITHQMILGLACLHAFGVSHGDVKNDNVLVGADGRVAYSDFDNSDIFVNAEGSQLYIDCRTHVFGAWLFLSPEAAECIRTGGMLALRPSLDSWALGMNLYHFWCSRYAFDLDRLDADALLAYLSHMARTRIHLDFRECAFSSPALPSLIQGFLDPDAGTRLTPLEAVKVSPLFQANTSEDGAK